MALILLAGFKGFAITVRNGRNSTTRRAHNHKYHFENYTYIKVGQANTFVIQSQA